MPNKGLYCLECLLHTILRLKYSCSGSQLCLTLCNPKDCSTPGFLPFSISWSLLKLMYVELMMPSNSLVLCCPLLLLPSVFPSIRWPKYWRSSFSISPSNEYSRWISLRIDWFDLLVIQGTLKILLRRQSLKLSAVRHSACFIVQLSHPHVTTGNTRALTTQTFASEVMSLLCICSLGLW